MEEAVVHLLSPWWLLLLLPLVGGLIILYLLKLRRRDFVVPSVFLWEQALQDLQANVPLQHLRKNLLLLVQLLVFLFAVFALARPAMQATRQGGQSVVLVIDASASMQATDVAPSRFAAAKKEGHAAIEALGPRDNMLIVAVGGGTRALTAFTTDKRALHGALDRLEATDGRADLRGALDLVAGLVHSRQATEPPRVVIVSDGAVPAVNLPSNFNLPIHFVKVGKRSDNLGIVMMDARRRLSRRGGYEGLLTIKNFSPRPRTFTMELYLDDTLLDARELSLKAGLQRTEVLENLPATGGVLRAAIAVDDDLAVDNEARVLVPKIEPIPVALVTQGNLFLKTALTLDRTLAVKEHLVVPSELPKGTVLIVDNVPAATLPAGVNVLLLGPQALGPAVPAVKAREAATPQIADWDRRHPVLEHVDLRGVFISSAPVLSLRTGARALVESDAGPLGLVEESRRRRLVYLGWDVRRSDFPLKVSFPIFVGNCIDWLSGARQRAEAMNVRTGQVVQPPLAPELQATITLPNGRTQPLGAGGFRVPLAGVYTITAKDTKLRFAANLADAGESNLSPHDLKFADRAANVVGGPVRTERELWRVLLLVALALLCAEWWVFHRRLG